MYKTLFRLSVHGYQEALEDEESSQEAYQLGTSGMSNDYAEQALIASEANAINPKDEFEIPNDPSHLPKISASDQC